MTPLGPLALRVRARWFAEQARLGLLWGLAGAAAMAASGRLLGHPDWTPAAALWGCVAIGAAFLLGIARFPRTWEVARAADDLGLQERVTSALHAARIDHPAAALLQADAAAALARVDPASYPLVPSPRRWRPVLLAALALAVAAVVPLPALGEGGRQSAEARTVAATRQSVEELRARLARPSEPEPLARGAAAELQALEEQLAQARSATEAARALEQAQERLAGLGAPEDYAWQRAMERLASAWAGQPGLGELARAMATRSPRDVDRALEALAAHTPEMGPVERQQLQLGLQGGANAARELPDLARALRQAAGQVGSTAGAESSDGDGEGALAELGSLLSEGAARSSALQRSQEAVAGLGQARAALGRPSGSAGGAPGALTGGPHTGSASGGQAGAGAPSGSGSGSGSGAGQGGEARSGGGTGSGSSAGSGSGTGSGTGSGSGSGAGGGAGAGGGPSPGHPGSGSAGPTGLGGSATPSDRGPTRYDPIYAPSLMGGEGGPGMQPPGDPAGASGETVELPNSPLELGAVRPYNEVYGRYEAAARQSLSRQSLPPPLQGMVQRYFSAIRPGDE